MEVCPAPNFHPHFSRQQSLKQSQNLQSMMRDMLNKIEELQMGQNVALDLSDIDALEALLHEVSTEPSGVSYQDRVQYILESAIQLLNDMSMAEKRALRGNLPDESSMSTKHKFLRRLLSSREDVCQNLNPAGLQNLVRQPSLIEQPTEDVFHTVQRKGTVEEILQSSATSWREAFEEMKELDSEPESEIGELPWDLALSNVTSPSLSDPEDVDPNEYKEEIWFDEVAQYINFGREEEIDTTDMATGTNDGISDLDPKDLPANPGDEAHSFHKIASFGWGESGQEEDVSEMHWGHHVRCPAMMEVAESTDGYDESDIESMPDIEGGDSTPTEPMPEPQCNMFMQQMMFVPMMVQYPQQAQFFQPNMNFQFMQPQLDMDSGFVQQTNSAPEDESTDENYDIQS
jgi:hypothetical protein